MEVLRGESTLISRAQYSGKRVCESPEKCVGIKRRVDI